MHILEEILREGSQFMQHNYAKLSSKVLAKKV